MHKMVKVTAKFVDSEKNPVKGSDYIAKLYDNDTILDDLLCMSKLNEDGSVDFLFDLNKTGSPDSPFETKPDLYVALYKNNSIVFESKVKKDTDFFKKDPISKENTTLTVDLGIIKLQTVS